MITEILTTEKEGLARAASLLQAGEVVAFPTETVYGLGANALDDAAVRRIFEAKRRPADNPLIVHVPDLAAAERVAAEIPPLARAVMERFWPGPVSLVLGARSHISKLVTAGLDTVAVRCPDHPVALALLRECGLPVAAPSANISGRPSGTEAAHVKRDFDGRIAAIIDGGACAVGLESTVIDARSGVLRILRPGAVTEEMLSEIGPVAREVSSEQALLSPGTRYPHYNPKAEVVLIEGSAPAEIRRHLKQVIHNRPEAAVIGVAEVVAGIDRAVSAGTWADPAVYAERLYGFFRASDDAGAPLILVHAVPESGLGRALMNRLRKAADRTVGESR